MHIYTVIKQKVQSLQTERNEHVFKQDIYDDSDGARLASFGIEFQTEEAKEKKQLLSVALLCAGPFRRDMVCELERVFLECGVQ